MKFLHLLRIKIDRKLPCTFLWTIRTTAMGTTRAMRGRDCALYVHIRRQQSSEPALISRRLVRVRRTRAWSGWLRACHWPTWRRIWWLVDWNSWNWEDLHNLNYLHIHIINWEDLHNLNHLTIHIQQYISCIKQCYDDLQLIRFIFADWNPHMTLDTCCGQTKGLKTYLQRWADLCKKLALVGRYWDSLHVPLLQDSAWSFQTVIIYKGINKVYNTIFSKIVYAEKEECVFGNAVWITAHC